MLAVASWLAASVGPGSAHCQGTRKEHWDDTIPYLGCVHALIIYAGRHSGKANLKSGTGSKEHYMPSLVWNSECCGSSYRCGCLNCYGL